MSKYMQVLPYTPQLLDNILADIKEQPEKDLTQQIVQLFVDAGLMITVKYLFPDQPTAYYRVLCFIKKSAETLIINTKTDLGKDGVTDGINLQLRILNPCTFEKLDEYNESICDTIINANDCRYCSPTCEGKRYTFPYGGKSYVKCQFLCNNFRFEHIQKSDIAELMDIINSEISYKQKTK